jgi:hypothetical protein
VCGFEFGEGQHQNNRYSSCIHFLHPIPHATTHNPHTVQSIHNPHAPHPQSTHLPCTRTAKPLGSWRCPVRSPRAGRCSGRQRVCSRLRRRSAELLHAVSPGPVPRFFTVHKRNDIAAHTQHEHTSNGGSRNTHAISQCTSLPTHILVHPPTGKHTHSLSLSISLFLSLSLSHRCIHRRTLSHTYTLTHPLSLTDVYTHGRSHRRTYGRIH